MVVCGGIIVCGVCGSRVVAVCDGCVVALKTDQKAEIVERKIICLPTYTKLLNTDTLTWFGFKYKRNNHIKKNIDFSTLLTSSSL